MADTKRYHEDPEYRAKVLGWCRAWRVKNADKVKKLAKARNQKEEYKAKARSRSARWRAKNRDQAAAATKAWNDAHPERVLANMKKYKLAKVDRCPSWLSAEDHVVMRSFYAVVAMYHKESDLRFEVDHIVPLRGRLVSGLHTPWNLRLLPRTDNRKKHNKFEVA